MTFDQDSITGIINRIIARHVKYMVPREGQVKDIEDPAEKGRVLVQIPSLAWDSNEKAVWCYPTDKNSLTTVAVDDWVIIQFVDGNPNHPICLGQSSRIADQVPNRFDGSPETHVLFEDPDDQIAMVYDAAANEMTIGNSGFQPAARENDTIITSITEDTTFWTFWTAFFTVITGATINEPGAGNPSALQAALRTAIAGAGGTPTEINGIINSGSQQVQVGDK